MKLRTLAELDALRRELRRRHQDTPAPTRRGAETAVHAQADRDLFARSVGPVVPLERRARAHLERPRPDAVPRQRLLDEAAVLAESISDEFDVESLLDTDDALSFRRPGIGPDVVRKLRRGVWVIQAHLDLHGLRREEARECLTAFLRHAVQSGLRCVRVVHGKGNGSPGRAPVLKAKVRGWLVQSDNVIAFAQARAADGGHGALVVLLRPSA
jgi:DNA-nicking Smr family endonuclease